jgi:hypothetical protein
MFEEMERWLGELAPDDARRTIEALSKENVRNHKNKRLDGGELDEEGYGGCGHGGGQSQGRQSQAQYGGQCLAICRISTA